MKLPMTFLNNMYAHTPMCTIPTNIYTYVQKLWKTWTLHYNVGFAQCGGQCMFFRSIEGRFGCSRRQLTAFIRTLIYLHIH